MTLAMLPTPRQVQHRPGAFALDSHATLAADSLLEPQAQWLVTLLATATGSLPQRVAHGDKGISLQLVDALPFDGDEAYRLEISERRVDLRARTPRGIAWAIQTLRQLLPLDPAVTNSPILLSCCIIDDAPAFAWRGLMLDCARHFMPIEFIYRWIDLLALHKLNVFHWHLTDDQGWRIEIKRYPRLTEIGAWRTQTLVGHALPKRDYDTFDDTSHGGFYTQQQIREVVAYAAVRGVTIVPEIEMPGHAQAAIAAYPELGNLKQPLEVRTVWGINMNIVNVEDATIQFLKNVLDEVIDLFPSEFIHIGGDEAVKDQWQASPAAQAKIRSLGLHDEPELQSWFIRQIATHLTDRGRRMIGWDEILEGGLPSGATVMSWRSEAGGIAAAQAGHDVIMTPCQTLYFDHYQSADRAGEPLAIGGCSTLGNVYQYQPIPVELDAAARTHVLGAQANLWTEYVADPPHAEYMAFPRACALAEILWRDPTRECESFATRLQSHLKRLDAMKVNYRK